MIFHWKALDAIHTAHTIEIIFGHKIKGMIIKKRRPDYVIVTREEVEKYASSFKDGMSQEKLEHYMYDVRMSLAYTGDKIIHIYTN